MKIETIQQGTQTIAILENDTPLITDTASTLEPNGYHKI